MNIALIGYGKMGKAIEAEAQKNGDIITLRISNANKDLLQQPHLLDTTDVIIEFTEPNSALQNIYYGLSHKKPVVCGSTGWYNQINEVKNWVKKYDGAFLYASNFSIGVNIFLAINAYAAKLLENQKGYNLGITEIHHTQKKDAPSGTAITIAETVLANNTNYKNWQTSNHKKTEQTVVIDSIRQDPAPGTHIVSFTSSIDDIILTHTAHNREGFAKGALQAAHFLYGKKGVYSMKDVIEATPNY